MDDETGNLGEGDPFTMFLVLLFIWVMIVVFL